MTIETQLASLRRPAPAHLGRAVGLGTGLIHGFATYPAPVGEVAVIFTPAGVRAVRLLSEVQAGDRLVEARPPAALAPHIGRAIEEGRPGRLPLDLAGVSPFRRSVLETAATIPRGEVRSYRWLADRVGSPRASRAVGSTMAANPVPLIVPCHRVVRSDGRVGAYSLGGPENKWLLLRHEGADPVELERLAVAGVRFVGSDTTGVFCVPSCRHARRITAGHQVALRSTAEAEAAGLRPCRSCRPTG